MLLVPRLGIVPAHRGHASVCATVGGVVMPQAVLALPSPGHTSRRAVLRVLAGAFAAPLAGTPSPGHAQPGADWPSKTVHYINPFPPGGATDTLSRLYCAKMSELAGQPFVVENRSGAGGVVGTEAVAKAHPTGTRSVWAAAARSPSRRRSTPSCPTTRHATSHWSAANGRCQSCWWPTTTCQRAACRS